MTKTTAAYEKAVIDMCQAFVNDSGVRSRTVTRDDFVGSNVGDVFEIWDMFVSVDDIKRALIADMQWEEFAEWYWENADEKRKISLKSWLMGARR